MTVTTLVCFKHHNGWLSPADNEKPRSPSCGCEGKSPMDHSARREGK